MNGWPVELALLAAGCWPATRERLGIGVPVQPGSAWIHGASLGEVAVARRLASALPPALVTTDTTAGRTLADALRPLDHPATLAALWAEARPRLLLWIESSWWPALSALAKRDNVPEVALGLRATPGVLRRYRLLGGPPLVFARTERDVRALAPHARVLGVSGSLKGGAPAPSPLTFAAPFLVASSAREGDAEALIDVRNRHFPGYSLLLAPRHAGSVPRTGRRLLRRSEGHAHLAADQDLLLDSWGELAQCLVGASAAVIGGTWDETIGGHTPNEARAAGVRFVYGPHTWSNPGDFVGGVQVRREQLATGLCRALAGPVPPPPLSISVERLERLARPARERSPRPWLPGLPPRRIRRRAITPWVIAVGSFNARGSGKTSTAAFLARLLLARGLPVRIVTRGVGRRARGVGDSALHGPDPWWLGDEGAALALQGFRVIAHPDRGRALRSGDDLVLLEDGLHAPVHADVRVETLDARFPSARGRLLRGEGRQRLATEIRIAHHHERFGVPAGAHPAVRTPGPWSAGFLRCVAFSGIGRPADFFATVPEAEATRGFRDHSWHGPRRMQALVDWAGERVLVTTDRDWVRVPPDYRDRVVYRGVRVDVPTLDPERLLP